MAKDGYRRFMDTYGSVFTRGFGPGGMLEEIRTGKAAPSAAGFALKDNQAAFMGKEEYRSFMENPKLRFGK